MKRSDWIARIVVVGFFLTVGVTASWCQFPATNDTSNTFNTSTGGGTGALFAASLGQMTGVQDTGYGFSALRDNLTGNKNAAFGYGALMFNQFGSYNTAIGSGALFYNQGSYNTGIGTESLNSSTGSGSYNTVSGYRALFWNHNGANNTGNGFETLYNNGDGGNNTAIGWAVLWSNTSGSSNTAEGSSALFNSNGQNNTALGYRSLINNTQGNRNLALGWYAGSNQTTGNYNIYVANYGVAGESNTMHLGESDPADPGVTQRTFIAGIAGVPVTGSQVLINSQGQLGILASSARFKRDIRPMAERSHRLLQLRPVIFRYKNDPTAALNYGLIAEEVAKVYPELVVRGAQGEVESVQYHQLIPMLLNEVQHQHKALEAQALQLAQLKAQNRQLRVALAEQNRALAARLERLEATALNPDTRSALAASAADLK
jgi:trimeric autotransporter adhesin